MNKKDLSLIANYALQLKKSAFGKQLALIAADIGVTNTKNAIKDFNEFSNAIKEIKVALEKTSTKEKDAEFAHPLSQLCGHLIEKTQDFIIEPLEEGLKKEKVSFKRDIQKIRADQYAENALKVYKKLQDTAIKAFEKVRKLLLPGTLKATTYAPNISSGDLNDLKGTWDSIKKTFQEAIEHYTEMSKA